MSKNREAAIRYRVINNCLKNKFKRYPSKDELVEACCEALGVNDISYRTIEQDIYEMRYNEGLGFMAPIEYSRREKGYHYTDENYSIDKVPLNSEDVEAIQFASSIFEQFRGVEIFSEFSGAVDKLIESMNVSRHASEKEKLDFIQFDNPGYVKGGEHLHTFIKVIKEKTVVEMTYKKHNAEEKKYKFHPYFLKQFDDLWYVIGWVEGYASTRTFALDRVKSIELLTLGFEIEASFDREEYYKNVYGVTVDSEKVEEVLLRFTKEQGNYIKTIPVHSSQEILEDTEEGLLVRLTVKPNFELKTKVLGYGANVEVVAPNSFREKVAKDVEKMMKKYC